MFAWYAPVQMWISIHAPTRGATVCLFLFWRFLMEFQSTLPQGERQTGKELGHRPDHDFNPRSHKGSDYMGADKGVEDKYFNPRSHKGSDGSKHKRPSDGFNFNPRSHKGSDFSRWILRTWISNFNPRSHKGSDRDPVQHLKACVYFNPRSHKGSDGKNFN